jgi:hypothetical protein
MTRPTVTELPRALEPVTRDPFIDSPEDEPSSTAAGGIPPVISATRRSGADLRLCR